MLDRDWVWATKRHDNSSAVGRDIDEIWRGVIVVLIAGTIFVYKWRPFADTQLRASQVNRADMRIGLLHGCGGRVIHNLA